MWPARQPGWLVIGGQQITLDLPDLPGLPAKPGGARRQASVPIDGDGSGGAGRDSVDAMLLALDQAVQGIVAGQGGGAGPGINLQVLVSDRWIATAALPWSAALTQVDAASIYARSQLTAAGFDTSPTDVVRIEDAPYREIRVAVAYPARLLKALHDAAAQLNAVLASVLPLTLAAAACAMHSAGGRVDALALIYAGTLTFLRGSGGRLLPMGVGLTLAPGSELTAEILRLWQRQRLRDGALAKSGNLHLLDLRDDAAATPWHKVAGVEWVTVKGAPTSVAATPMLRLAQCRRPAADALDAVAQRRPATLPMRVAALALVAMAGAMASQAASVLGQVREQQALAVPAKPQAPVKKAAKTRDQLAQVATVNAAIQELNLPISDLLRALQPPRDIRVGLLAVEVAPRKPAESAATEASVIKLSAEAPSGAEMARYVAFLSDRRPFTSAYLVSHEVLESDPAKPYRFIVEASWHD